MKALNNLFDRVLRIHPEDNVPSDVAANFKHNVIANTIDLMFFFFSDSLWSINTIMPVFAATLTDSPFLVGLIPAVVNAGWFIPQLFMSGRISKMPKVLPFSKKMGFLERLPYMFLPLLTLLIGKIENQSVYWLLLLIMIWRGIGGGMSGLPWQEINARVIPITHRARFFGISRVFAQLTGVLGSLLSIYLLGKYPYPQNYAIGFVVAVVTLWISFAAYAQNREPEIELPADTQDENEKPKGQTWSLMKQILKADGNFRRYLTSRSLAFLGNMATAFLAVYAIDRFKLGDAQAAVFTALILVSGIFGYILWGSLGDRIGPQKVVILSFVTWGLGLLVAIFSQSLWVYYAVFAAFGLYSAGLNLGDTMLVMELGEERLRPTYLGMARTLTGAFLLLAPILSGWLVQRYSYLVMFTVSLGFVILATILMATVKDRPRRRA
ncbi:MAG: MFS transporter [Anaerolineaceae bacterium]|jgi:MFS family permease|nr:MFS transporter [Anaerolineaceae bacterium]MDD4042497.1 MFS transporter [Anaerolineaceae bacterium]